MTNRFAFHEALFAIWHAGLVAVPCNAKLRADELRFVMEDSGSALTLTRSDCAPNLVGRVITTESTEWRRLGEGDGIDPVTRRPDDLAWLFYTSGTTGRPKGAMLMQRNLVAQSLAYYADVESVDPSDVILHLAPMSHGSGLYGLPFVAKAAHNVVPESASLEPDESPPSSNTTRMLVFSRHRPSLRGWSIIQALPARITVAFGPSSMVAARCISRT
jgi:long-chain acyl-CoA synthetase